MTKKIEELGTIAKIDESVELSIQQQEGDVVSKQRFNGVGILNYVDLEPNEMYRFISQFDSGFR